MRPTPALVPALSFSHTFRPSTTSFCYTPTRPHQLGPTLFSAQQPNLLGLGIGLGRHQPNLLGLGLGRQQPNLLGSGIGLGRQQPNQLGLGLGLGRQQPNQLGSGVAQQSNTLPAAPPTDGLGFPVEGTWSSVEEEGWSSYGYGHVYGALPSTQYHTRPNSFPHNPLNIQRYRP
ncbi:hypothetical protein BCR39DRAFT_509252 [Naematelia encephala]|uniref:Uncharacterized protein n=1 Tax=Naematelia encephala TaxID=71784 RepID=A0A1Y2BKV0_9TREE|nr:hypothetical protein BCR39DRAFT_509252 [Naematelia encephala]